MRVGILTFHRAENFGAVLQAYALQTFLQDKGCDVSIIDYRNQSIEAMYVIFNPLILFTRKNVLVSLRLYLSKLNNISDRKACKSKYKQFRNVFFHQTRKIYSLQSLIQDFDSVIVGSDQVWNLHLTGGLDKNFFLDFPKDNSKIKKIAYAASAEVDPCNLLSRYKEEIEFLLNDFDYLSVREDFLRNELRHYTDKKIEVCLDPTFLLGKDWYEKMVQKPLDTRYILVYHMTPIPIGAVLASKIAESKGCKVIEIHVGYGWGKGDERHKVNLGPMEILNYIVGAQEVVTSSFHGLALSLIMKKNVWVIDKGNNLRQRNLLISLNLNNHLLTSLDDYNGDEIDYVMVDNKLKGYIQSSQNFICNAVLK